MQYFFFPFSLSYPSGTILIHPMHTHPFFKTQTETAQTPDQKDQNQHFRYRNSRRQN